MKQPVIPKDKRRLRIRGSTFYIVAAIAGLAGPVLFGLLSTIAGLLWPGYDPVRQTISQLALGPQGRLQTAVFFLLSFLAMLFVIGLYPNVRDGIRLRIGITLLFLSGFGFLLIGIFPNDPPETIMTLRGLIHQTTIEAISILFPFACFPIVPSLKHDPRWENLATYTFITGVLGIILDIIGGMILLTHWLEPWFGLYERILTANALVWLEVMAIRLLLLSMSERREESRLA